MDYLSLSKAERRRAGVLSSDEDDDAGSQAQRLGSGGGDGGARDVDPTSFFDVYAGVDGGGSQKARKRRREPSPDQYDFSDGFIVPDGDDDDDDDAYDENDSGRNRGRSPSQDDSMDAFDDGPGGPDEADERPRKRQRRDAPDEPAQEEEEEPGAVGRGQPEARGDDERRQLSFGVPRTQAVRANDVTEFSSLDSEELMEHLNGMTNDVLMADGQAGTDWAFNVLDLKDITTYDSHNEWFNDPDRDRRKPTLKKARRRFESRIKRVTDLQRAFAMRDMLVNPLDIEPGEDAAGLTVQKNISFLLETYNDAYHMVDANIRVVIKQNTDMQAALPEGEQVFLYTQLYDGSITDKANLLLLHVLFQCRQRNLRHHAGYAYQQQTVVIGGREVNTHAWKPWKKVEEMVDIFCAKETNFKAWQLKSTRGMFKHCVEQLERGMDRDFPELKMNPFMRAFLGDGTGRGAGIYVTYYSDAETGIEFADTFVPYSPDEDFPPDWVCCRAYDYAFDLEDMPVPDAGALASFQGDYGYVEGEDAAVFFDETLGRHIWPAKYFWMNWPTPSWDKIFFNQNVPPMAIATIYAFLGRLQFPVGEFDNFQVIPFIKGLAGTGKSTLGEALKLLFDDEDVAVLSSNIEKVFGLESLMNCLLYMCLEVKKTFSLPQGEFQSMISGEDVSIKRKNKVAHKMRWTAQGIMMGNEPGSWVDTAGSMKRRLLMIEFSVRLRRKDPNLREKLRAEFPVFLRKITRAYFNLTQEHGRCDVWEKNRAGRPVIHPWFHDNQKRMNATINPLAAFLEDTSQVVRDADQKVELGRFKKQFNRWSRDNNYERAQFGQDMYISVFGEYGIHVKKEMLSVGGRLRPMHYVVGVNLVDEYGGGGAAAAGAGGAGGAGGTHNNNNAAAGGNGRQGAPGYAEDEFADFGSASLVDDDAEQYV